MKTMAAAALLAAVVLAAAGVVQGQSGHQHQPAAPAGAHQHGTAADPAKPAAPPAGRVVPMEELHRAGGVPRGWKFTLPAGGDPARGRQLFADLECYKCHLIKDAGFPPTTGQDGKKGPELTGMGAYHPAEYFAQSILDPNAVIVDGPGHIGPDGRSVMPSFTESLSVTQMLDLVAFLKSQEGPRHDAHAEGVTQEQTVGPYRVRLTYSVPRPEHGGSHGSHHQHQPPHHGGDKAAAGHLMAFVTDAESGEAVPYLPVSAGLHARGAAPRTVKLTPMMSGHGFHYGADVAFPEGTQRIVLSIGASTMRVAGADRARFARPHTVSFDWSAPAR